MKPDHVNAAVTRPGMTPSGGLTHVRVMSGPAQSIAYSPPSAVPLVTGAPRNSSAAATFLPPAR